MAFIDDEQFGDTSLDEYLAQLDAEDDDYEDDEEGYEEDFEIEIPEDKEEAFRLLLTLETDVATPSVFQCFDDDTFEWEKESVEVLTTVLDQEEYTAWKETYLAEEMAKVQTSDYAVCTYMFAGIGDFEVVIPKAELDSFKAWVVGNNAFLSSVKDAAEEDVKTFIALHARQE